MISEKLHHQSNALDEISPSLLSNITQHLISTKFDKLFTFFPTRLEPDISEIPHLFKYSSIFTPYFHQQKWLIANHSHNSLLHQNKYGIYQVHLPTKSYNSLAEASFSHEDITLVPGIAFDQSGSRLGKGLGIYDRYLGNSSSIKIGICFETQIVEQVPLEPHDVKMDYIITESRVIKC